MLFKRLNIIRHIINTVARGELKEVSLKKQQLTQPISVFLCEKTIKHPLFSCNFFD